MKKMFLSLTLLTLSSLHAEDSTESVRRVIRLRNTVTHAVYPGIIVKYVYQDGSEKLTAKGFDEVVEEGQDKLFTLTPKANENQSPVVAIELAAIGCSATPDAENPDLIEVEPFGIDTFDITEIEKETSEDHELKEVA